MDQIEKPGQAGMRADDKEFLMSLGLAPEVVATVDPCIIHLLKSSERFKNAFTHLHQIFRRFDNLPS
jgi:uncharacterized membrane protein